MVHKFHFQYIFLWCHSSQPLLSKRPYQVPYVVLLSYNNDFFLGRGLCLLQADTVFRFFILMTLQMYFKHLKYSLLHNNFPLLVALL